MLLTLSVGEVLEWRNHREWFCHFVSSSTQCYSVGFYTKVGHRESDSNLIYRGCLSLLMRVLFLFVFLTRVVACYYVESKVFYLCNFATPTGFSQVARWCFAAVCDGYPKCCWKR